MQLIIPVSTSASLTVSPQAERHAAEVGLEVGFQDVSGLRHFGQVADGVQIMVMSITFARDVFLCVRVANVH